MFLVEEGGKCVMLAEGVLHLLYLYSILFVIVSLNELSGCLSSILENMVKSRSVKRMLGNIVKKAVLVGIVSKCFCIVLMKK